MKIKTSAHWRAIRKTRNKRNSIIFGVRSKRKGKRNVNNG